MKFKSLLDRWNKAQTPIKTIEAYPCRLTLDDAARLHALAALFRGLTVEDLIVDLLHSALDEVAAAMPYEPGPKVISHDEHGDPVYEDVGLTPRFLDLTRQYRKKLEAGPVKPA